MSTRNAEQDFSARLKRGISKSRTQGRQNLHTGLPTSTTDGRVVVEVRNGAGSGIMGKTNFRDPRDECRSYKKRN